MAGAELPGSGSQGSAEPSSGGGPAAHCPRGDERRAAVTLRLLERLLAPGADALDLRAVLDGLFEGAQEDLAHDGMSISFVTPDQAHIQLYATSGALRHLPLLLESPIADPTLLTRPWDYELIDDQVEDPRYTDMPSARAGMRSAIVIPLRFAGQLRGWVNVFARAPRAFTTAHAADARRVAAHVALALSYEVLADHARRHETLRVRASNLELLDELLTALVDAGDPADVFDRVATIAAKVLRHDALALLVRTGDGREHRTFATRGFPAETSRLPDALAAPLDDADWDHDIVDDIASVHGHGDLAATGVRALLRVPIRLDGRIAGALVFVSREPGAFAHGDLLVAHRIADRLAVTLARTRVLAASRRADEAGERAARLEARVKALTDELDARTGFRRVVGESRQWRQVLTQATQVAATETTALLLGESGTGKEVIARFLHRASSRKGGPFIALNCAALPEQLLEAELFGYERGAYTGATQSKPGQLELASGGTLFLDEVGEMSPGAQAKFLRVLQEREFQRLGGTRVLRTDARIVAATNRDLLAMIARGQFREDLYYRLNVFPIRLPALRDRRDDILPLSEAFLQELGRGLGLPPGGVSRDARLLLLDYHWPGNVRELRNILERAAILCDGGLITADHLALSTPPAPSPPPARMAEAPLVAAAGATASSVGAPLPTGDLAGVERSMIEQALQTARFNKSKAAKALGLTRHQLYIRMRRHGFE